MTYLEDRTMRTRLLLLLALALACRQGTPRGKADEFTAPPGLYGTWRLARIVSGMDGVNRQLDSSRVRVTFSEDGVATFYEGDSVTKRERFGFRREKSIFSGQLEPLLTLGRDPLAYSIDVRGDTLALAPNAYDAGATFYVRVR